MTQVVISSPGYSSTYHMSTLSIKTQAVLFPLPFCSVFLLLMKSKPCCSMQIPKKERIYIYIFLLEYIYQINTFFMLENNLLKNLYWNSYNQEKKVGFCLSQKPTVTRVFIRKCFHKRLVKGMGNGLGKERKALRQGSQKMTSGGPQGFLKTMYVTLQSCPQVECWSIYLHTLTCHSLV